MGNETGRSWQQIKKANFSWQAMIINHVAGMKSPENFILPHIQSMHAYMPGLQPATNDIIKLNTNENPFPPIPAVQEAIKKELNQNNLHLYPNPRAENLRQAIASHFNRSPRNVLVGNGSDEILTLLFRATLSPEKNIVIADPTYSLYTVLADSVGASYVKVALQENWSMNLQKMNALQGTLKIITNPNAPTGFAENHSDILHFARQESEKNSSLVLVDEAYIAFGGQSVMKEAGSTGLANLMACGTFSKAYSLAGARIGWLMADERIIEALDKIRDSYNMNRLSQIAGIAALSEAAQLQQRIDEICKNREKLIKALAELDFQTIPSAANFIFTSPKGGDARSYFEFLESGKILVRYFPTGRCKNHVRITIGTEQQMDAVIERSRQYTLAGC